MRTLHYNVVAFKGLYWGPTYSPCTLRSWHRSYRDHIAGQQFADDTQLESPCDMDEHSVKATVKNLEHCCRDIKTWMLENRLKLNDHKTEILLCRPASIQNAILTEHIQVGESDHLVSLCQGPWTGYCCKSGSDNAHRQCDQVLLLPPQVTAKTPTLSDSRCSKCHCGVSHHVQAIVMALCWASQLIS